MIIKNANIDAFLAIAELGSVSVAAKKLLISQAGTTQRIQALERELDVSLFTRGRRGMKLTTEGQFLFRYCQEAKGLEGRLLAGLKKGAIDRPADLTITTPASLVVGRFAEACAEIYEKWPQLNLRFMIDTNANRLDHLKKGSADLAVVLRHEVTPELDSKLLKPLEYLLVGPVGWASRKLNDVLSSERLFAYHPGEKQGLDYLRQYDLLEQLRRPRLYVNDNQSLERLISLGVGFGLVPKELALPHFKNKTLAPLHGERSLKVEMALVWYPRANLPSYFQEIIKALK